ncbi:MAG: purine-binding chemotaxis protein CheW [Tissierellia bacterium]|nr:purine-binding chemotaxis protein CheW [Tissierellia bacterium]
MDQYIVFVNKEQKFAINVSKVERILEYKEPKRLPDSSPYFLGVIQYNGSILPIIDLTKRLYDADMAVTMDTKIVVVNWKERLLGLVVDDIIGIQSFTDKQFEEFDLDIEISSEYIIGFIKSHGDIIVCLDIDRVFDQEQEDELILATNE